MPRIIVLRPGSVVGPVQGPGSGSWPGRSGQFFFWKNQNDAVLVNNKKNKSQRVWGRVSRVPGRPAGSTGSGRVNFQSGFGLHPDRSHARVGRVPGRPAGPVRILKLCPEYRAEKPCFGLTARKYSDRPLFIEKIMKIKLILCWLRLVPVSLLLWWFRVKIQ